MYKKENVTIHCSKHTNKIKKEIISSVFMYASILLIVILVGIIL